MLKAFEGLFKAFERIFNGLLRAFERLSKGLLKAFERLSKAWLKAFRQLSKSFYKPFKGNFLQLSTLLEKVEDYYGSAIVHERFSFYGEPRKLL